MQNHQALTNSYSPPLKVKNEKSTHSRAYFKTQRLTKLKIYNNLFTRKY